MTLKCISLNIRGINKTIKRRKLFRYLHNNKFDVVYLQETYCSKGLEDVWRNEWGGKGLYAHGSNHSRGVMILFNPNVDVEFQKTIVDCNGRFIITQALIENSSFCFVNLYLPNLQSQQVQLLNSLQDKLREFAVENFVIGGDFNCPISDLDKFGERDNSAKSNTIRAINEVCNNFTLVDIWRQQHPECRRYTWSNPSGKIKCRLDYWLISQRLSSQVEKSDITAYYQKDTDHEAVTINIKPAEFDQRKRGPGFWKLNSSLLENDEFVIKLRFYIKYAAEKHKEIIDKRLSWEMIKKKIRTFSIRLSKRIAKKKRQKELDLLRELNNLKKQCDQNPNDYEILNKSKIISAKLDKIAEEKTKGSIVRSKTRWYELGEKTQNIFFISRNVITTKATLLT